MPVRHALCRTARVSPKARRSPAFASFASDSPADWPWAEFAASTRTRTDAAGNREIPPCLARASSERRESRSREPTGQSAPERMKTCRTVTIPFSNGPRTQRRSFCSDRGRVPAPSNSHHNPLFRGSLGIDLLDAQATRQGQDPEEGPPMSNREPLRRARRSSAGAASPGASSAGRSSAIDHCAHPQPPAQGARRTRPEGPHGVGDLPPALIVFPLSEPVIQKDHRTGKPLPARTSWWS
jgi:hypothetical protein